MCNLQTKRCEAPALECETDVDCPGDQFCNLTLDPPVCQARIPDCLNDLREGMLNNDSAAAAASLTKMEGPLFTELRLCPGDEDWYEIPVEAGTYLTVDARFTHADADIELQLYLDDGQTLLDESRTITDNERVEIEIGTNRRLLVRVFLQLPILQAADYELIISHDAVAYVLMTNSSRTIALAELKQSPAICPSTVDYVLPTQTGLYFAKFQQETESPPNLRSTTRSEI